MVEFTDEEAELLRKVFGYNINRKMEGTAYIINKGKGIEGDVKVLEKRLLLWKSILNKIKYEKKDE